jgi:MFS superfamily sulfate permease-like transporter
LGRCQAQVFADFELHAIDLRDDDLEAAPTSAATLDALARNLSRQGVRLGLAGFRTETRNLLERTGVTATIGEDSIYATLKMAMETFQTANRNDRNIK